MNGFPREILGEESITESIGEVSTNPEEITEEKINDIVEQLTEAAKTIVITPEIALKLDNFHKQLDSAQSLEQKKQIWLSFFLDNKDAVSLLLGRKVEEKPDQNQEDNSKALREELGKIHDALTESLTEQIKSIVGGDVVDEEKLSEIKNLLLGANFKEEDFSNTIKKFQVGQRVDDSDVAELMRSLVDSSADVVLLNMVETELSRGDYEEKSREHDIALEKLIHASSDGERENLSENLGLLVGVMLKQYPMGGVIDLIFATGAYESGYYSSFEKWGEILDKEKEKDTLLVLENIAKNELATTTFFADLVDDSKDNVLTSYAVLGKLESLFNSLESKDQNKTEEVKKKISQAIEKTTEIDGFKGESIDWEKMNLSQDVLRQIISMAKKSVKEDSKKTSEGP